MYKTIYVPVDNSDYSNLALDVGVSLAKTFGAKLVGSHVYAAKMHDKRFKQMEAGLPEEYHDENELERQRQIHDSLITRGLHIITGVLNEEAGKVFRFKEQEKLHEEIIDSGLAKIYQAHLDIGREIAQAEGQDIKTTLLDGKAFEKVLQYVRRENPWMLVMGRIGVHSDDDMDIGSNTENLLRMVDCHVMISNKKYVPPIDQQAEYTIAWTEE